MPNLVDFAIITALPEEFKMLQEVFVDSDDDGAENSKIWYRSVVESKDQIKKYHVVLAFQSEIGSLAAYGLVQDVIRTWNPAYIILTGIAGSLQKEVKLGDIIVSQQIIWYDLGKAINTKEGVGIQYRPQGYPCSITLIRQAEALSFQKKNNVKEPEGIATKKIIKEYKKEFKNSIGFQETIDSVASHQPSVHFGTVASGSLVVASEKKKKDLMNIHGKILGTEMEGAGVMHASFYEETPTPAILIKGISDHADSKKASTDEKEIWRKIALVNATYFVHNLIRMGKIRSLATDEFNLLPEQGTVAEARNFIKESISIGNSLKAFPKLVIPSGPLTTVMLELDITSRNNESINILVLVAQYKNFKGEIKTQRGIGNLLKIEEPISPSPLGIYLLLSKDAGRIAFNVETYRNKKQVVWSV